MKKVPLISIIIPTYNRDEPLRNTLKCCFSQAYLDYEIIIVDQSDKKFPEKEKFLEANKKHVHLFFSSPPNAALARNIGIKKSKGDIIIFLDDDVVFGKDLIRNHVGAYVSDRIGARAGRVVTEGQIIESKKSNAGRITWFGKFTDGFSSTIGQEVQTVITCNASWRKDVLVKIGYFDENFSGPLREDSDLSLRTIRAGYKIVFEPKASVVHKRAETGGFRKSEGRLKWYFGFFKGETYFFLKHRPKFLVPVILLTRIKWALRCMFGFGREVSRKSISTPLAGITEGIKTYRRWKNENRN